MRNIGNRKVGLFCSYTVIITIMIFYLNQYMLHFSWDSFEYINLSIRDIMKNGPDEFRTPGYILLIDFFQWCLKGKFLYGVEGVQIFMYFVGMYFFYKTFQALHISEGINILFTCVYHFLILDWVKAILPESIILSLVSIWFFLLIKYLSKSSVKLGMTIGVLSLIMTMIRPSSLLFLLIVILFFLVRGVWEKNKDDYYSLFVAICMLGICFMYCMAFLQKYENFSLSNTLLRQKLYIAIERDYYRNCDDPEAINLIDSVELPLWDKMTLLYELEPKRSFLYNSNIRNSKKEG